MKKITRAPLKKYEIFIVIFVFLCLLFVFWKLLTKSSLNIFQTKIEPNETKTVFKPNHLFIGQTQLGPGFVFKTSQNATGKVYVGSKTSSLEIPEGDYYNNIFEVPINIPDVEYFYTTPRIDDNFKYLFVQGTDYSKRKHKEITIKVDVFNQTHEIVFANEFEVVGDSEESCDSRVVNNSSLILEQIVDDKYVVFRNWCFRATDHFPISEFKSFLFNSETKKFQYLDTYVGNVIIDTKNRKVYANKVVNISDKYPCDTSDTIQCSKNILSPEGEVLEYDLGI